MLADAIETAMNTFSSEIACVDHKEAMSWQELSRCHEEHCRQAADLGRELRIAVLLPQECAAVALLAALETLGREYLLLPATEDAEKAKKDAGA